LVILVASPHESVAVPSTCTTESSHLPARLQTVIPDVGTGTLLTSDAHSSVVIAANYGGSPFGSDEYLISKGTGQVLQHLHFDNDVVSGAIDAGRLYLFNDKILHIIDSSSGDTLTTTFESDNYRGLYTSDGIRYLQTNVTISALGPGARIVFNRRLKLMGMAFGCLG
jgi:hypothetical protein